LLSGCQTVPKLPQLPQLPALSDIPVISDLPVISGPRNALGAGQQRLCLDDMASVLSAVDWRALDLDTDTNTGLPARYALFVASDTPLRLTGPSGAEVDDGLGAFILTGLSEDCALRFRASGLRAMSLQDRLGYSLNGSPFGPESHIRDHLSRTRMRGLTDAMVLTIFAPSPAGILQQSEFLFVDGDLVASDLP